jgi:hypothetical protein
MLLALPLRSITKESKELALENPERLKPCFMKKTAWKSENPLL